MGIPSVFLHPQVFVRESVPEDAPFLARAYESQQQSSTRFPVTVEKVASRIDQSGKAFSKPRLMQDAQFMFTIVEPSLGFDLPVGSASLFADHASKDRPHHALIVPDLDESSNSGVIQLKSYDHGISKVQGLFVHRGLDELDAQIEVKADHSVFSALGNPDYLRVGSWIRFLWASIPEFRPLFEDKECLAELIGHVEFKKDGTRTNPLFESVAGPSLGMTYDDADWATENDRTILKKRYPSLIHIKDLSKKERGVLGDLSESAEFNYKYLKKAGLKFRNHVDPLDGGRHLSASFRDIPLFNSASEYVLGDMSESDMMSSKHDWEFGLLGHYQPQEKIRFRACSAPFMVRGINVYTTPHTAHWLRAEKGSFLNVVSIKQKKKWEVPHLTARALLSRSSLVQGNATRFARR